MFRPRGNRYPIVSSHTSNIMKKHSINSIAKKFFLGSLSAAILFLSVQRTYAGTPVIKQGTEVSAPRASFTYLGNHEDALRFGVQYTNESGAPFRIEISNETGEVVYRGNFREKQFSKTFELPKSLDFSKLSFVIRAGKEKFGETFSINVFTKTVEDVVVSRN